MSAVATASLPDAQGHFGPYGGRYVPETLMAPLQLPVGAITALVGAPTFIVLLARHGSPRRGAA